MENKLIVIDPKEYGLEKTEAAEIEAVFVPMIAMMKGLEKEYNEIISQEITPAICLVAKTLRLKYVKTRTGTKEIHRKAKAYYLAGGRFVDSWKNAQEFSAIGKEEKLEDVEKYFERIEEAKKEKLLQERIEKLSPYVSDTSFYNLKEMSVQGFDQLFNSSKIALEAQIAAEKKAEADQFKREKAEQKAREKQDKEFEALKKKTIAREKEIAEQQKKDQAEKEKLEAEQNAKLEVEKKEREKAEAELKAIRDTEEKAKEDENKKKADQDRLAKETRYKDFLKENEVNEETKHLFHIEKVDGQVKLYKVIGTFNI